jgi:predicted GNAT family N-acyltransferase
MNKNPFTVKLAKSDEEKMKIFCLRYEIYIEEMGKKNQNANHTQKTIIDPLDDWGNLLYIEIEGQVIATIRINLCSQGQFPKEFMDIYKVEYFLRDTSIKYSFSSRLMVHKNWRNSKVTASILNSSYSFFREHQVRFNFLNSCTSLLQLYHNLGCRKYTDDFIDSDVGLRTPLVLLTEDAEHLKKVKSIYYILSKKYENNIEDGAWFEKTFALDLDSIFEKPLEKELLFRHCN